MPKINLNRKSLERSLILFALGWLIAMYTQLRIGTGGLPLMSVLVAWALSPWTILFSLLALVVIYGLLETYQRQSKAILDWLYHYRYGLALAILIIGVLLEVNGSSIGIWSNYIGTSGGNQVLLGTSRALRSDEWGASSPLGFSQVFTGFSYFSPAVRGGNTDMFIVYGQPVWDWVAIFRPAYWGYLFLGLNKGLSFFWIFRNLLLFMTSFELGMLLTKQKKSLSTLLAILITLSPVVQWWFAVNGIVEILSMGSLAILILDAYCKTTSYKKRALLALALAWVGMVYILVFYPAWQVPMGYVFLMLVIYVFWSNWSSMTWSFKKDGLMIALFVLAMGLSLAYIVYRSGGTLKAVLGTVYPGNRLDTGGKWGHILTDSPFSIFYTLTGLSWERGMDVMYDFFPLSSLYAAYAAYKTKDKLLYLLLGLNAFFFIYIVWGVPALVAKLTLLSYTMAVRVVFAFGVVNVLLLVRSLTYKDLLTVKKTRRWAALLTLLVLLLTLIGHWDYLKEINQQWTPGANGATQALLSSVFSGFNHLGALFLSASCLVVLISGYVFYKVLRLILDKKQKALVWYLLAASVFFGGLVNPLRVGSDVIYENQLIKTLQSQEAAEKGTWLVEGLSYPFINIPLFVGAKTINSTNVYPDMAKWALLDPSGQYADVYNRYAHIQVEFQKEGPTSFQLTLPDTFIIHLFVDDLSKLGVSRILTKQDLTSFNTEKVHFSLLETSGDFKIYAVTYP